MGLRLDCLQGEHIEFLQKRLTLKSIPFQDQTPQTVRAFHITGDYLWVPRFYDWMDFWPKIKPAGWQWICPVLDYDLQSKFTPDPARQQPEAIETLVEHLKRHSSGIGVLPTGIGKTYLSYEIGRHFQTPMAILVHKGDMIDNWVEHAESHLGIPSSDVSIIKESGYEEGKPVSICSIQTLLSRDLPDSFYNQFGFVVADEVHHYGAAQWSKVIGRFPARYRLGVSADPIRDDGLDPIVRWNFGKVGFGVYKRASGELPLVCLIRFPGVYRKWDYYDGKRVMTDEGPRWVQTRANAMKYAKVLSKDKKRNSFLVSKLIDARSKGRKVLIFSKLRDHVKALHDEFTTRWAEAQASLAEADRLPTRSALLWGGLKDRERKSAMTADMTFTTYGFSKEATNLPHKDTLALATPAGDPLQTIGRLRDKGAEGRQSFLAIDLLEGNEYSFKKAMERRLAYAALWIEVKRYAKM
jgi:superfamily II DNA or RNA helicase